MIPVMQTRLGKTGNCFEASIASLLNLHIEDVPDLLAYEEGDWLGRLNIWLAEKYNLAYFEAKVSKNEVEDFFRDKDFFHVMTGFTARSSSIGHAVIGRKGKMVHDPHPDNIGILEDETITIGVLVSQCL